jgi:hypothetical protein
MEKKKIVEVEEVETTEEVVIIEQDFTKSQTGY